MALVSDIPEGRPFEEEIKAQQSDVGPSKEESEGLQRVRDVLTEAFGFHDSDAVEFAAALGSETVASFLERWLGRANDAVEVLHSELTRAGPRGVQLQRCIERRFGLVQFELPDELEDGDYWAEVLDELADRSAGNFNTLHRYSTDISQTPFPSLRILEALREPLERDFDLSPDSLYLHASFFIHYGMDRNLELCRHRDHSLLTLNVCLKSDQLEGCGVRFFGAKALKGANAPPERFLASSVVVDVPPGAVLMHWGDQEHETAPLKQGERWNVILWFKKR